MFKTMISRAESLFQPRRRALHRRPVQLVLESLEQRDLLAAYTWHFRTPNATNWSIAGNWDDAPNHQATAYPGQNGQTADTAAFDGSSP